MSEMVISLDSVEKVKKFVTDATKFDTEMDIVSGRYIIDAKSILGIFSMDLSKPMILRIHEGTEKEDDIIKALSEYVIEL